MVDIMYVDYEVNMVREAWKKQITEDDAPSTPSSIQSSSSSSSHDSDEDVNESLQAKNVELRKLI